TDKPVMLERDEAGNVTVGERSNNGRRKTGKVMNVRDIRPEVVDDAAGDGADLFVQVCLLERARAAERVVHPDDAQAVALLGANIVFGPARILVAGEDDDLVAEMTPQRARGCMRVGLGDGLSGR